MQSRRRPLPLSMLLLGLVLGLSGVLVSYGAVNDAVRVHGFALTDEFSAGWFGGACEDTPANRAGGQPIATATLALADGQTRGLNLAIGNAYPGLRIACDLYLANDGQMPVVVRGMAVDDPNGALITEDMLENITGRRLEPCGLVPGFGAAPSGLSAGCQARARVQITVGDVAQSASYSFSFRFCVSQGDVEATSAQCFAGTIPDATAPLAPPQRPEGDAPLPAPPVLPAPIVAPAPVTPLEPAPVLPAPGPAAPGPAPAPAPAAAAPVAASPVAASQPTVEVLPLTPEPAAPPAAAATPGPIVEVMPLRPDTAGDIAAAVPPARPDTAPAAPQIVPALPRAGTGSLSSAASVSWLLLGLILLSGGVTVTVLAFTRRRWSE